MEVDLIYIENQDEKIKLAAALASILMDALINHKQVNPNPEDIMQQVGLIYTLLTN